MRISLQQMLNISEAELVSIFGLRNCRRSGDNILCSCPIPGAHAGGDKNPSFSINVYNGLNLCFSCGWQGNIYQLAEQVLGMSQYEAHQKFDMELTDAAIDQLMQGRQYERKVLTPLQQDISRWTQNKHPYWYQRGFTDETIGKFQLGYSEEMNRVVVPIYFQKELVGWTARQLAENDYPKWKHSEGLAKSEILYGMDKFSGDSCVLVEAPLSVVMLDQHGVSNAVSSFGCKLSDSQARLLRSNYNNILVFYDPDTAGQEGAKKAVEMLEDFMEVYVAPITRDDPAAMSLEENLQALSQAKPAWLWEVERG